jgi:hypothetical protein
MLMMKAPPDRALKVQDLQRAETEDQSTLCTTDWLRGGLGPGPRPGPGPGPTLREPRPRIRAATRPRPPDLCRYAGVTRVAYTSVGFAAHGAALQFVFTKNGTNTLPTPVRP